MLPLRLVTLFQWFLIAILSYTSVGSPLIKQETKAQAILGGSNGRISRWAAVGDSYAAGLGAGLKLPQWSNHYCSRYNQSYPFVLHTQDLFHGSTFDYYACSGSSSVEVLASQLPKLSKTHKYDVITLSIGGNDVHFASFLDACIFQWSGGTNTTCEAQLNATAFAIKADLQPRIHTLLTALYPYLSLTGKIYQTGYARFFDPFTEACDNVTWSFWYSGYGPWEKQYLTRERRVRMNELVTLTNKILKETAEMFYPHVEFVEIDREFEAAKGRFCEQSINEPDPSREGLLFYEWNTVDGVRPPTNGTTRSIDPYGERRNPCPFSYDHLPETSFEKGVVDRVRSGRARGSDQVSVVEATGSDPRLRCDNDGHDVDIEPSSSSDVIPDGFMRVFHPRPGGHQIIAKKLEGIIRKDLGEPWLRNEEAPALNEHVDL